MFKQLAGGDCLNQQLSGDCEGPLIKKVITINKWKTEWRLK